MFDLNNVRQLHLEVTTKCNAACPMCARNMRGDRVNPNIPTAELSLQDVERMIPLDFVRQLEHVYLCGNYGDASVARDTLEILRFFREASPSLRLGMHTNGSPRQPEWWADVAKYVSYAMFGIDGLEDTNHLYRRNTIWNNLMRNCAAFIAAGGKAEWEYIVFEHNEHQIEEAEALSKRMGFSAFRLRYTSRFLFKGNYMDDFPVYGNAGQVLYQLRPPKNSGMLNPAISTLTERVEEGTYDAYLDSTHIACQAIEDRKLFISAEGLLFPCCFTGHIYPWHEEFGQNQVYKLLMASGGKAGIDARTKPLADITNGEFFDAVAQSWNVPSIKAGRLRVCSEICGECRTVKAQYTESRI
jgi:MoaA/NifB/PqqE/SkfB family radical SAM enzyme